ncbi:MAG: hypothetical protein JXB34_15500 [Bacteroidales bacterium]|nr:hypothetical protein [Bacteroidales bacterium]
MKKIIKVISLVINSILHPSHVSIIFRDLSKILPTPLPDEVHLNAAINWLCKSQDAAKLGGCAGVYTFEKGWTGPYPETTGYIIPTFIQYAELTGKTEYVDRAKRMGDWEISIQLSSGAVRGGVGINEYPIVFNTGQVMLGWVALYKKTQAKKYLDAAVKASEWLVSNMDDDGKWSKNTFNNIPHAYNVRVTWALLKVAALTGNNTFYAAAIKNINWVLSQYKENAWFGYMSFSLDKQPLTHTIAYTLRGLLECSFLVEGALKNEILEKVTKASLQIKNYYLLNEDAAISKSRGFLPGTFNNKWKSGDGYSCLTGNVQMAIIWMKLYKINGDKSFFDVAVKNIEQVKSTQNLNSHNSGINGGIAGSYPIWGKYTNFGYPNWAAKFFADAIMLKNSI